ncbi:MAG: phage terminase small subunit P27 family [Chloroflexi bacterium]|nr:phage terminase small subunit P27 family [Chloroflexota bacterium]
MNRFGQGRRPKPATVTERQRNSIIPTSRLPSPPGYLSPEAVAEWHRVAHLLKRSGLNKLDVTALAAYCVAYVRWMEAEDRIREHGLLLIAPNGRLMPSPYLSIANKALDQITKLLAEFGMTPASRTRLPVQVEGAKPARPTSKWANMADPRSILEQG